MPRFAKIYQVLPSNLTSVLHTVSLFPIHRRSTCCPAIKPFHFVSGQSRLRGVDLDKWGVVLGGWGVDIDDAFCNHDDAHVFVYAPGAATSFLMAKGRSIQAHLFWHLEGPFQDNCPFLKSLKTAKLMHAAPATRLLALATC